jgi:hypothetical protein
MAEASAEASSLITRDEAPSRFSDVLRNATGVFSAGAGAIHFGVIQSHFEEYWAFGVFFATAAWLQILWAMWVVARPGRVVALIGIAINGTITVVWIISRTVGIPFGPEPGVAEAVEFVDVAATSLQVLAVLGALGLLTGSGARREVARGAVVSFTLVLVLSVAVLTTAAIISFTPHEEAEAAHEEEEPAGDEHEEEEETGAGALVRLPGSDAPEGSDVDR